MDIQQRSEHPREADAGQHAGIPLREVQVEETVIDEAQRNEHETADEDLPVDFPGRAPFLNLARIGERERKPRNEQEHREDHVHDGQAVPLHVAHLPGKPEIRSAGKQVAEADDQGGQAHDQQHVHPPQGVDGKQAFLVHYAMPTRSARTMAAMASTMTGVRRAKQVSWRPGTCRDVISPLAKSYVS